MKLFEIILNDNKSAKSLVKAAEKAAAIEKEKTEKKATKKFIKKMKNEK